MEQTKICAIPASIVSISSSSLEFILFSSISSLSLTIVNFTFLQTEEVALIWEIKTSCSTEYAVFKILLTALKSIISNFSVGLPSAKRFNFKLSISGNVLLRFSLFSSKLITIFLSFFSLKAIKAFTKLSNLNFKSGNFFNKLNCFIGSI